MSNITLRPWPNQVKSDGRRWCVRCRQRFSSEKIVFSMCPACVRTKHENSHHVGGRFYWKETVQKREKDKIRNTFCVSIQTNKTIEPKNWYGPFEDYMSVYKFIERVYPKCSNVPEQVTIETCGTLQLTKLLPAEDFYQVLCDFKVKKEEERSKWLEKSNYQLELYDQHIERGRKWSEKLRVSK